ncbi:hypothetical protein DL98DRAFT_578927 [Cadophora sp. DSE1049]|nr:hypothetical protein DL98DRAFT_578927 [Cadophora sp. DSE1049]
MGNVSPFPLVDSLKINRVREAPGRVARNGLSDNPVLSGSSRYPTLQEHVLVQVIWILSAPRKRLGTTRHVTSDRIQIDSSRAAGMASVATVYFKVRMAERLVRAEGNASGVGVSEASGLGKLCSAETLERFGVSPISVKSPGNVTPPKHIRMFYRSRPDLEDHRPG